MSANPSTNQPAVGYGEVFDRGYQHYTGERLGRRQAFRSLIGYSIKRAMGIRKPWTSKILPILLYAAAIIPLIVIIGVAAVVPTFSFGSYSGYFAAIFTVEGIFVATIAPEMLCPDRRERTLPLYFARAISRTDYILAKLIATFILTLTMSLVPAVILWFGRQLVADHPWRAMRDNVDDLWKLILVGTLTALFFGTLGLLISSLTDRKGIAVTVIVVGFLIITAATQAAFNVTEDSWRRYLIFLSLNNLIGGILDHLFHDVNVDMVTVADFPLGVYIAYILVVVALSILIIRWLYRPRD
ncbi:MAG TPA: ABC transporter permease [Thermomicrobiales bacterium]|nr:ABC transporter permease [Thermomicrobiales bacterium]